MSRLEEGVWVGIFMSLLYYSEHSEQFFFWPFLWGKKKLQDLVALMSKPIALFSKI